MQAKPYATPPLTPTLPGPFGWQGDPTERPVTRQPSYDNTPDGRTQFTIFLREALENLGLSHDQSLLFIAHLARETGWGSAVYNYNFGNIKAGSNPPHPWFWLTDRLGYTDKYRAYDRPEDGLWDDIALIRDHSLYQKSWALLMAGDPNWYSQLGLDGYYEGPPDPNQPGVHTKNTPETVIPVQHEYNQILAMVQQYDQSQPDTNPAPPSSAPPQLDMATIWKIAGYSVAAGIATWFLLEAPSQLVG